MTYTFTFTTGSFFYHHCCRGKKVVSSSYMGGWVGIGKHLRNVAGQLHAIFTKANIIAWVLHRSTFRLSPSILFTIFNNT